MVRKRAKEALAAEILEVEKMMISDLWIFGGFLSVKYELNEGALIIDEKSPVFCRHRKIPLCELSSNYSIVKQGIPQALVTTLYLYAGTIALDLFDIKIFNWNPRNLAASIVLFVLIIEHFRLFRVAQFPFKKEQRAVQVRLKHEKFILELVRQIRKEEKTRKGARLPNSSLSD